MDYNVKRVLADQGSSADILFWEAFVGMKIPNDRLIPYVGTLVGFAGDQVMARGVMPFDLKNAGVTYQRLMDKVLVNQLGRNVEAYVDDMVVKSASINRHFDDLQELFDTIDKYQLKLNPEKCSFGVQVGKFLDFLLTHPDKVLSFFQFLKKNDRFTWTTECEEAFAELKRSLASPPILTKPRPNLPLLVYISASNRAVSSVLVQEQEASQVPIYFVSRVLQGAKTRTFLWKNMICKYGVPQVLVSDNGTQFASGGVRNFCREIGIQMTFTSDTPFNLAYGTDTMIPIEIAEPSVRTTCFSEEESKQGRRVDLDLIIETRERARINQVAAQRRATFKYNTKVVPRAFVVGDLVLKRAQLTQMRNKLSPKWVGPYKIDDVVGKGAYRLKTLDGGKILRTWNAANLRFYYS
uniref:Retrovirus-related Pol polyprotein from transposon 412 family n=1 Tax=Cajanus cajan TaxID=3821 RepID=A0A151RNU8_CAJCA|nr:Retrovirus-related Pol polyprotein from transposon 412 family [Cajanus cajan]